MPDAAEHSAERSAIDLLREVIELMEEHDLAEVKISESDIRVHVKRQSEELIPLQPMGSRLQELSPSTAPVLPEQESHERLEIIKSPMLGTFYRSPEADQPSFVEVGSQVSAGDTLCLIEAMKVFTDLKAEFDCEIVDILVEDSQPVEYDQPLFQVRRI